MLDANKTFRFVGFYSNAVLVMAVARGLAFTSRLAAAARRAAALRFAARGGPTAVAGEQIREPAEAQIRHAAARSTAALGLTAAFRFAALRFAVTLGLAATHWCATTVAIAPKIEQTGLGVARTG